ncbi:hypothetical protein TSAR_016016 [Trichomalopsis sarcophagae]|uniref:Uncharacterized protein n=1 Tax=Trichomalopsis sarcophagae TaxID=543379 RepID=A0A232ENL1_9HYME|nr:hypothetical protein TSAR_016016 [Trichomalopsis sarcophagae]
MKDVFTQGEWYRLIKESKTNKPYIVKEITQDEIFNFDEFLKFFHWKKIKISSVKEICVKNIKGIINLSVKYNFAQTEDKLPILKKNFGWKAVKRYELPDAYHSSRANRELDIRVNPRVASANWFTAIFLILISQLLELVPRH